MKLQDHKLDKSTFETALEDYNERNETIMFATYDNYRVLKQTDNYLEKYLPFMVQNIVSLNINSFLKPAPKEKFDTETGQVEEAKPRDEWTMSETLSHDWYENYKAVEYDIYKDFHRAVLNDDGVPLLKKTAFRMPGYRKVLGGKSKEYEIDNSVVQNMIDEEVVQDEIVDTEQSPKNE